MKHFFIKIHQILGSLMSLVFLVWFLSGFVMIYSGFPHADQKKAFEKQESLGKYLETVRTYSIDSIKPQYLKLQVHHGKPFYNYQNKWIDANSLEIVKSFETKALDSLIRHDYGQNFQSKEIISDFDSWIPWSHFQSYFPIHKYEIGDAHLTRVYVSEKTGTVVQETTSKTRWFARFGAIPHWFYFKILRLKKDLWADFIIWLSGIGCVMCLSGLIVGIYRSRKWRKAKKKGLLGFTPYKKRWYKWHHVLGMTFGFFVFTFVFSGMLSMMSIPKWLIPIKKEINYGKLWREQATELSMYKLSIQELLSHPDFADTKTIEWRQIDSIPYYLIHKEYRKPILVDARYSTTSLKQKIFTLKEIKEIATRKFKGAVYNVEEISAYDGYYNNPENAIAKFRFDDDNKSWLYIDMHNPDFTPSLNKSSRLRRWLYHGLHTFNFPVFAKMSWLRKTLLIIVSIFGTIISFSGVILSYKYLRRKLKRRKKK